MNGSARSSLLLLDISTLFHGSRAPCKTAACDRRVFHKAQASDCSARTEYYTCQHGTNGQVTPPATTGQRLSSADRVGARVSVCGMHGSHFSRLANWGDISASIGWMKRVGWGRSSFSTYQLLQLISSSRLLPAVTPNTIAHCISDGKGTSLLSLSTRVSDFNFLCMHTYTPCTTIFCLNSRFSEQPPC